MNSTQRIETDCGGDGNECDCNDGQEKSNETNQEEEIMSDNENPFADVANLTVDAVREQSNAVDTRIEKLEDEVHELQDAQETLSAVSAYLEVDGEDSILETVKSIHDEREALQDSVDSYKESELSELREAVTDTAEYTDEEVADMDEEQLKTLLDMADRLGVDSDGETETDTDSEDEGTVKTPTTDSSEESSSFDMNNFNPVDAGMAGGKYGELN